MYRRSARVLAAQQGSGRTIVRDPRKVVKKTPAVVEAMYDNNDIVPQQQKPQQPSIPSQPLLPFAPSQQNRESIGSSMVSYALAGVGVTLGVILVRVVLGF
jgi:hypothetical protein